MAAVPTAPLPTLAIAGTARDIRGRADDTVPGAIKRLSNRFDLQRFIVIESDSVDGTLQELQTWPELLRDEVRVDVISQRLELLYPPHRYPQFKLRTERIAYAVRRVYDGVACEPGYSSSRTYHATTPPHTTSLPAHWAPAERPARAGGGAGARAHLCARLRLGRRQL